MEAGRSLVFDTFDAEESLTPVGKARGRASELLPGHMPLRRGCQETLLIGCLRHTLPPALLQVRALAGKVGLATLRVKEAMAAVRQGYPLLVGDREVRQPLG